MVPSFYLLYICEKLVHVEGSFLQLVRTVKINLEKGGVKHNVLE